MRPVSVRVVEADVPDEVRMVDQIVLMVSLRLVERFEGGNLSDNRPCEHLSLVQLFDVGFGDALLLVVCIKDCGAILRAGVGALPV